MPVIRICENCGFVFKDRKRGEGKGKYCSRECGFSAKMLKYDRKYTGKKFGYLTVLSRSVFEKQSSYLCRCDCGKEVICRISHLIEGSTVSCGCYKSVVAKIAADKNFIRVPIEFGTRFGRLIVLREDGRKYNLVAYECLCDCGNFLTVSGRSLRIGDTRSCGCYKHDVNVEQAKKLFTKHGMSKNVEYIKWTKRRRYKADHGWVREMDQLLLELQPVCVVCGSNDRLAVDHVIPVSKGGRLEPGNAVTLCKSCNSAKRNKNLDELDANISEKISKGAEMFRASWNQRVS